MESLHLNLDLLDGLHLDIDCDSLTSPSEAGMRISPEYELDELDGFSGDITPVVPQTYLSLDLERDQEEDDEYNTEHPVVVCSFCFRTFTYIAAWAHHQKLCSVLHDTKRTYVKRTCIAPRDKPEKWCHKRTI